MAASTLPEYQRRAVAAARQAFAVRSITMSDIQKRSIADADSDAPPWVSKTTFLASQDSRNTILDTVISAIKDLETDTTAYTVPSIEDVDVIWTFPPHTDHSSVSSTLSEQAKFDTLMQHVGSDITILYLHGGGFSKNSPATYQSVTDQLSSLTKARCICPRYRLAPQHPFPAPLVDVLLCYLSLLHPPAGSFHAPIPASKIVLAGDSAGANLGFGLLQIIHATRSTQVNFHGQSRSLPLPAGIATLSAGLDASLTLPSWTLNSRHDIFAPQWTMREPDWPPCALWPSKPPRTLPFCEASAVSNPLVAPAVQRDWSWAPPMWFACGQEQFADSAKAVAETAAAQGVGVWYEEYEEMPHVFPIWATFAPGMSTSEWPQSKRVMERWAEACDRLGRGEKVDRGATVMLTAGGTRELDVRNLTGLSVEERLSRIKEKQMTWQPFVGRRSQRL